MSTIKLSSQLQQLSQLTFTGSLSIVSSYGPSWKLYFRLGRLIWLTGMGNDCQEKWQRLINSFNIKKASHSEKTENVYYYHFFKLIQRAKLVGATDFISKSSSPVEIQTLVCKYLNPSKCCKSSFSSNKSIESKV